MMHPACAEVGPGDSGFVLASPENEVRGKVVYDVEGQLIGSLEDLYVDPQERAVLHRPPWGLRPPTA